MYLVIMIDQQVLYSALWFQRVYQPVTEQINILVLVLVYEYDMPENNRRPIMTIIFGIDFPNPKPSGTSTMISGCQLKLL